MSDTYLNLAVPAENYGQVDDFMKDKDLKGLGSRVYAKDSLHLNTSNPAALSSTASQATSEAKAEVATTLSSSIGRQELSYALDGKAVDGSVSQEMEDVLDDVAGVGEAGSGFRAPNTVIGVTEGSAGSQNAAYVLKEGVLGAYISKANGGGENGTIVLEKSLVQNGSVEKNGDVFNLSDVAIEEYGEAIADYASQNGVTLAAGDAGARVLSVVKGETIEDSAFEASDSDTTKIEVRGKEVEANAAVDFLDFNATAGRDGWSAVDPDLGSSVTTEEYNRMKAIYGLRTASNEFTLLWQKTGAQDDDIISVTEGEEETSADTITSIRLEDYNFQSEYIDQGIINWIHTTLRGRTTGNDNTNHYSFSEIDQATDAILGDTQGIQASDEEQLIANWADITVDGESWPSRFSVDAITQMFDAGVFVASGYSNGVVDFDTDLTLHNGYTEDETGYWFEQDLAAAETPEEEQAVVDIYDLHRELLAVENLSDQRLDYVLSSAASKAMDHTFEFSNVGYTVAKPADNSLETYLSLTTDKLNEGLGHLSLAVHDFSAFEKAYAEKVKRITEQYDDGNGGVTDEAALAADLAAFEDDWTTTLEAELDDTVVVNGINDFEVLRDNRLSLGLGRMNFAMETYDQNMVDLERDIEWQADVARWGLAAGILVALGTGFGALEDFSNFVKAGVAAFRDDTGAGFANFDTDEAVTNVRDWKSVVDATRTFLRSAMINVGVDIGNWVTAQEFLVFSENGGFNALIAEIGPDGWQDWVDNSNSESFQNQSAAFGRNYLQHSQTLLDVFSNTGVGDHTGTIATDIYGNEYRYAVVGTEQSFSHEQAWVQETEEQMVAANENAEGQLFFMRTPNIQYQVPNLWTPGDDGGVDQIVPAFEIGQEIQLRVINAPVWEANIPVSDYRATPPWGDIPN